MSYLCYTLYGRFKSIITSLTVSGAHWWPRILNSLFNLFHFRLVFKLCYLLLVFGEYMQGIVKQTKIFFFCLGRNCKSLVISPPPLLHIVVHSLPLWLFTENGLSLKVKGDHEMWEVVCLFGDLAVKTQ